MTSKLLRFRQAIFILSATAMISTVSCGPGDDSDTPEDDTTTVAPPPVVNVEGEIFSIPSPMQMAILIKQVGANYNKDILNPAKNVTNYSSNFQKALNLGIYGADLGYVTLYDQTQDALGYMQGVKRLGDDLGITGAFDMNLMTRFEQNIGKKDSMLALVSDAYRASDAFLKNNDRNELSALVLTGGWIESLYFALNVNKMKSTPEVTRRIGEQKTSLESLIRLLKQHESQPEYAELVGSLQDLMSAYDGVEFVYEYKEPVTDASKNLTTITSQTNVKITPEQIKNIQEKLESIRKQIVG